MTVGPRVIPGRCPLAALVKILIPFNSAATTECAEVTRQKIPQENYIQTQVIPVIVLYPSKWSTTLEDKKYKLCLVF